MDEPARIMLTNYIRMAISCSRTAAHTTSWVARASRCPVEPWENKNRSNGGKLHGNQEESRQEKETLSGRCSNRNSPKPLERSTSREAFPLSLRPCIAAKKTLIAAARSNGVDAPAHIAASAAN